MSYIDEHYPKEGVLHFFYVCDKGVTYSDEFLCGDTREQNKVIFTTDLSNLVRFQAPLATPSFSSSMVKIKFENTIPDAQYMSENNFFDSDEEAMELYHSFYSDYDSDIGFRFFGYIDGLQYGSQEADIEPLFQANSNQEISRNRDEMGFVWIALLLY